ncbi:response regulator [Desulfoferrobacter suflitae]|uniref:response regulator n=1 Tax=Desulfoferrobacter suflitae TaxID=2865782 RepID=UPI0021648DD7|nr:response regulator transcription factor [Desulfoferrobacter suflitae]MCK8601691.1 response regulator transcription factor [Desulfoferrobacter suflitae]
MSPKTKQTYQVLLADDHMMFRHGIRRIIEETSDLAVIGEVSDGLELLKTLKTLTPDLVILDISMPNLRGIEVTHEIKNSYPAVKVLILTMHKDKEHLLHSISAGAEGYLLKEDADSELFSAIRTIREGGVYISPLLSAQIADVIYEHAAREASDSSSGALTFREREVLKLIAEGRTSKEIATILCISVRTIHHHRSNIMKKLKISNTADLIKYAIRKGYTSAAG